MGQEEVNKAHGEEMFWREAAPSPAFIVPACASSPRGSLGASPRSLLPCGGEGEAEHPCGAGGCGGTGSGAGTEPATLALGKFGLGEKRRAGPQDHGRARRREAWGRGEGALGRPGAARDSGGPDRLRAPSGLGLSPAAAGSGPGGTGAPPAFAEGAGRRERRPGDGEAGGCGCRVPRALARRRDASEPLPKLPEARGRGRGERRGWLGGSWARSPAHPRAKRS